MAKLEPKIRSDIWEIAPNDNQAQWLRNTVAEYRHYVRPLVLIVYWNWTELRELSQKEAVPAIERLFNRTKKNPEPKYAFYFDQAIDNHPSFRKFPSYLRRAAIAEAIGIVSSFVTRWDSWKAFDRKKKTVKPPRLTAFCHVYPDLYKGNQLQWGDDFTSFQTYVWDGSDWRWSGDIAVKSYGMGRVFLDGYNVKSPTLIGNRKGIHLSVPFQFKTQYATVLRYTVGVDIGINNTATASVVSQDGTVIARKFIHLAGDIDRRDRRRMMIKRRAKKTIAIQQSQGFGDKLPKNHCRKLYRKSSNINEQIAQFTSRALVNFAQEYGAEIIVFEDLKHWKAKAGRKGALTKQRFHQWCKDRIVELTKHKSQEASIRVKTINAKYTSKYAYDGSGKVKRSRSNYSIATFTNGKIYNCDLSASYNIAARYWYSEIVGDKFFTRVYQANAPDTTPRIPVTLASLWALSSNKTIAEQHV